MQPGDIYGHEAFYRSPETGRWEAKYLVILATLPGGDLVARLLTSRPHGRPESPPCFHGYPYPSFYLGVPGGPLSAKSWVDLRFLDDFDREAFRQLSKRGLIQPVITTPAPMLPSMLKCVAGAEDTLRHQEKAILNTLAVIR